MFPTSRLRLICIAVVVPVDRCMVVVPMMSGSLSIEWFHRVTKDTYPEVIDKVKKRLASWKSHTFSMAGRLTLLQSVTAAIPIYTMASVQLPAATCNKLDKFNRDFLC